MTRKCFSLGEITAAAPYEMMHGGRYKKCGSRARSDISSELLRASQIRNNNHILRVFGTSAGRTGIQGEILTSQFTSKRGRFGEIYSSVLVC